MGIRNKALVSVALFGILFLLFTGSASAAVDFPADEAGISAYVKAKPSIPNLNVVKPALATIERENMTAGYIIGTVAMDYHTEEQYPHVYVSTDGWVVAYYPKDRPSSWLLADYAGGQISTTTLEEAVVKVCDQIDGDATGLKYYDFRHPDAMKMMIIAESGNDEYFEVTIPTSFTTYRVDWWHAASTNGCGGGGSIVYLDGSVMHDGKGRTFGSLDPSTEFINGAKHKIELNTWGACRIYYSYVGLVIEYEE